MILLIDNYDSFTYNLFQYISELGFEVKVLRNDALTVDDIRRMAPEHIVISPGPGRPEEAGIILDVIRTFAGTIPILGVCLGHQAIGQAFGGRVVPAPVLMHGKTSEIIHEGKGMFRGIPNPFEATRYHSLVVSADGLPDELEITARTSDGVIMGLRHRTKAVEGIQFHPESVMTGQGKALLKNALSHETAPGPNTTSAPDFLPFLDKAVSGKTLAPEEMKNAIGLMMTGQVPEIRVAGFLAALRTRGESVEELAAACGAMMDHAVRIRSDRFCVDTCGTGGDGSGTFNVSTVAAFVAAGAGVCVAKHGNRSITSRCGSSDVLQSLGIKVDARPALMEKALNTEGIAFFFAPLYHPAMKYVMGVRRELKVRTMFNILGPLSNPASAQGRVLGVFDPALLELIPQVLLATGVQRAFVLRSQDGMDELSLNAPSDIVQVAEGGLKRLSLDPQNLGFRPCHPEELAGGTAEDNARKILFILNGERGPARDITVLNAAAAILTAGLARDFAEAIVQAERAIDSRRAYDKLQALKRISNEAAG